jgi:uncharacterized damage-inducible protein DinB
MINPDTLGPVILDAFTGKTTWLEASSRFPLDEIIDTFYATRPHIAEALEGLTDAQAAFVSPVHPFWSISESITHLIYSQGGYLNQLLDISTSTLPHAVEAARGFGQGAKPGIPARQLRQRLAAATEQIHTAIDGTRSDYDANKVEVNEFFGACTYNTWMLLLLAHELDHLRQIVAMRRVARSEKV